MAGQLPECSTDECPGDCADCIFMYESLSSNERRKYDERARFNEFQLGHPMGEWD